MRISGIESFDVGITRKPLASTVAVKRPQVPARGWRTTLMFKRIERETSMSTKTRNLMVSLAIATATFLGAAGSASAADEWFVLGQQTIKATDPSTTIKSTGGRWEKDVKEVKLAVEGADVQITNLVLHWDNRPDDTIKDVGVLKSGGQTAAKNAPGLKGRLKAVTVQYKILGGAKTADLKVMGYD